MRKKYHTIEELRRALAERQARWRAKNRGYERIRAKGNYKRRVGGDGAPADRDRQGIEQGVKEPRGEAMADGGRAWDRGIGGRDAPVGETYYGPEPGVDVGYEEAQVKLVAPWRGGQMEPEERVVTHTENEIGTYEKLVEMVKRKKAAEEGIEVEM